MTDQGAPTLDDTLAHYGVKGMRWGVKRASGPAADLKREAKGDVKAVNKATGSRSKAATATRAAVKEKRATRPEYEKAYGDAKKNAQRVESGKTFVKTVALGAVIVTAMAGPGPSRTAARSGANFVKNNPGMMTATLAKGAYKVTTL